MPQGVPRCPGRAQPAGRRAGGSSNILALKQPLYLFTGADLKENMVLVACPMPEREKMVLTHSSLLPVLFLDSVSPFLSTTPVACPLRDEHPNLIPLACNLEPLPLSVQLWTILV